MEGVRSANTALDNARRGAKFPKDRETKNAGRIWDQCNSRICSVCISIRAQCRRKGAGSYTPFGCGFARELSPCKQKKKTSIFVSVNVYMDMHTLAHVLEYAE